jgi:Putative zinc-finger
LSGHVQERLSAYLDGELAVADRQAVEAHLQLCDECGRHLEDLAAVDELARALPVEAPGGYFEALPARVRFKVAPRRRRAPRIPAWSWAVAAALLVAVVTPVLLRQNPQPAEVARSAAPAPAPMAAPGSSLDSKRLDEKEQAAAGPRPPTVSEAVAPATALAERRATASYDEMQPAPAPPAAAAPGAGIAQGTLARNAATAPLAKTEEAARSKDKAREASSPEPARTPSTPPAGTGLAAPPPEDSLLEGAAGQHLYEPKPESDADDGPAAEAKKATAAPRAASTRLRNAEAGRSEAPAPRLRFRALLAQVPGTTEEVRRLREQWRAFVAQEPPTAQADEGRVRIVEMGAQAWRLSNDPADLAMAKQDAEAYLRREDAAQGDRVRTLLITLGN